MRLRGGGGPPTFTFNGMSSTVQRGFSRYAPEWRIVQQGINFHGICENKNCPAFLNEVIVPKGFGIFDMKNLVGRCDCPMCDY